MFIIKRTKKEALNSLTDNPRQLLRNLLRERSNKQLHSIYEVTKKKTDEDAKIKEDSVIRSGFNFSKT